MSPSSESKIGEASDNWGAVTTAVLPLAGVFLVISRRREELNLIVTGLRFTGDSSSEESGVTADLNPRGFGPLLADLDPPIQKCYYSAKIGCLMRAMLEVNFFTSFASLIEPSKCRLADWLAYASGKI